jgi:carboxyl-terminal processing protease
MSRLFRYGVVGAAFTAAIGVVGASAQTATDPEIYQQLNFFGDAYDRVRRAYVDEVPDEKLIHAALNALLGSLDPYSTFLTPSEYEETMAGTTPPYDGLGLELTMSEGVAQVVAAIDGSPAARAGLRPKDLIVDINQSPIWGMTLNEATAAMHGEPGTTVDLLIVRNDTEVFTASMQRESVPEPAVTSWLRGTGGYIRAPLVAEGTAEAVAAAISSFSEELGDRLGGVVLDLRSTPSRDIQASLAVANLFIDGGELGSIRGRNGVVVESYSAEPGDVLNGLPLIILVGSGTAGGTELLVGAAKDSGRGILLGTSTFGAGRSQTIVPVGDFGYVQLTTGYYYTPSGEQIEAAGVGPEISVEPSRVVASEPRFPRRTEASLRGALDNPTGETEVAVIGAEEDYQLARAFDLLQALALLRRPAN